MSATTKEKYPSLAEIVRQETDGGRLIVQFYLGVAYGDIEGFRDHHRAAAARRIDKIAPGLVREYLTRYHNAQVRESMRHTPFPMGSIEPMKKEQPERRGPNRFQRRLTQLVRQETAGGRNIVNFMIDVMDGALTGFKPHHRLEAAKELAAYITLTPSPLTGEGRGEGDSPAAEPDSRVRPHAPAPSTPTPSPSTGEGRGEGDSPAEEPALSLPKGQPSAKSVSSVPSVADSPTTPKELARFNFQPHHLDQYHFGRDEVTGALYAFDHIGPVVIDDDGETCRISPDLIVGYERAYRAAKTEVDGAAPTPSPLMGEGRGEGDSPAAAAKAGIQSAGAASTRPQPKTGNSGPRTRMPRKLRRQLGDARARQRRQQSSHQPDEAQDDPVPPELTPTERRIRKKLEQHWHGPDPLAGEPFFHNYVPP